MKTPVMIDMNLTEDFALGFMTAARSENLEILGITLSFGETDLACAAANTAGLQRLMNTEIPVALGAEKPWRRDYTVEMEKLPLNMLDPDAASMVLSSKLEVVMCPCDMGFHFYAKQEEIDWGMKIKDPLLHQYNRLLKKKWCEVNEELPMGCRTKALPLQEVAAVLWLVKPELFTTRRIYGEVDLKGKLTFGMLVIDIKNRLETKAEDFNICWINGVDRKKAILCLYGEV